MKYLLIIMLGLKTVLPALACDVCGSGGAASLGILPQFRKHFIGLRYRFQNFQVTHPSYVPGVMPVTTRQSFQTADLWGRFYPSPKVQMFFFLPYKITSFVDQKGNDITLQGVGDLQLMVNYMLFQTGNDSSRVRQLLLAGGGIKLPTGKRAPEVEGSEVNPNLQPGTGAYELIINTVYTLRLKKSGLNAEAMIRIPRANEIKYRLGPRVSSSVKTFLWEDIGSISLLPQLGISMENAWKDRRNGTPQDFSGGNVLSATAGTDAYFGRFLVGAEARIPFIQDLSEGNTKAAPFFSGNVVFFF